ncbi:MAG: hypothetical protein CJBNEKGG_03876 [Prosthecobacter sp.]|nr:hypothetical protein [Prosthecobacter sp.]
MTLLSLASKQIWPHILTVQHFQPTRLVLLHSDDITESKQPAQRLKKFFDRQGAISQGSTSLELLSSTDFDSIEKNLDALTANRTWNLGECILNITGGNKLMATAAFRWAARRGVRTCYLERGSTLTEFTFQDGNVLTHMQKLDGHLTNELDPVALLRCQVDASEVEREGESLTLTTQAQQLDEATFFKQATSGVDATRWLTISGSADADQKEGDGLEFTTAAILLKLGVRRVQRSLRLKVKSAIGVGTRLPHAELDLLFTWGGRLWIVDCKDRKAPESLAERFKRELRGQNLSAQAEQLLERIKKELSIGQTKVMKEDLLAIREAGGIQGQVLCVRKTEPSEEVAQFARHNHIPIIPKSRLVEDLRAQLFPNAKPDSAQLQDLANAFKR